MGDYDPGSAEWETGSQRGHIVQSYSSLQQGHAGFALERDIKQADEVGDGLHDMRGSGHLVRQHAGLITSVQQIMW